MKKTNNIRLHSEFCRCGGSALLDWHHRAQECPGKYEEFDVGEWKRAGRPRTIEAMKEYAAKATQ